MCTYIILDVLNISGDSVNDSVFTIKFTIDFFRLLNFLPLFVCLSVFLVSFIVTRFLFCSMVKKLHRYAKVVMFLTFCIPLQACAEMLQCKRGQSVYGIMLRGHVFQEHNAVNLLTCGELCNSKLRCQSVNYVMNRHLCELNSRTKEARPEDYVQDADRVYLTRPIERGKQLTLD